MRYGFLLPLGNAIACCLFVALRAPVAPAYLAEIDAASRDGAVLFDSGSEGMLACRPLHSWSSFHGGEHLGVKVFEAANLLPLIGTGLAHLVGLVSPASVAGASFASACARSWALAAIFLTLATTQWLGVGWLIDRAIHRAGRTAPPGAHAAGDIDRS